MLTRLEQIVTAAHRDLQSCMYTRSLLMNPLVASQKTNSVWLSCMGQNHPPKKSGRKYWI